MLEKLLQRRSWLAATSPYTDCRNTAYKPSRFLRIIDWVVVVSSMNVVDHVALLAQAATKETVS